MSLTRNSPILSSLSARRKHHIHTAPTDKTTPENASTEKREQPFGELKFDADTKPTTPSAYKSIFSLK